MYKNKKKIWITGASSGIGKETAILFAKKGWVVVVSARRKKLLNKIYRNKKNIIIFSVDVNKDENVKKIFNKIIKKIGSLDCSLFGAGIYVRNDKFIDLTSIKKNFQTNFFGVLNCIKVVSKHYMKKRGGHISIISSTSGYRGLNSLSGYGASKAALINFAETLFIQMKKYNTRVSLINPGFVKTNLIKRNKYKVPFVVNAKKAGERIYDHINNKSSFELVFPKKWVYILKLMKILPYNLYFYLMINKILYKLFYKNK